MKRLFYWLLSSSILLAGCGEEEGDGTPDAPSSNKEIAGYVQKGPFITGTSITVQELKNDKLTSTGRTFETQIKKDDGSFKLNGEFTEDYAEIIANGYYFNEITGKLSKSPITLRTLSKISAKANININVLTTLQSPRIKKLIAEGKTFEKAMAQSQEEVLKAFHIDQQSSSSFDQCNIVQKGEDNAILLAISSIMQNGKNEAELSEFVAKVANDVEDNGTLDTQNLQQAITQSSSSIDNYAVQANLRKRFKELGITDVSIPNFYGYLDSDGDGVLNNAKPYVNSSVGIIYIPKNELRYTLNWSANCTPKVILPEGCDWIHIEECTSEKLVFTLTKAEEPRNAVLAVYSSADELQEKITIEQQGSNMYFQVTMRVGNNGPRYNEYDFFDNIVSDICIVAFDNEGKMLFMKKEENPQISGSTYKCYVKLDDKLYQNCTIYTIVNSPYDFSGFQGSLSEFHNLQSNVDLNQVSNIENFYIGETANHVIDNLPPKAPSDDDDDIVVERPAPVALMKHPVAKVECVVLFRETPGTKVENVLSLTMKGSVFYDQGNFFNQSTAKKVDLTLNTLVDNKCTLYLYGGSIIETFDLVLDESGLINAKMPKAELEANKFYRLTLNVERGEVYLSFMSSDFGYNSNVGI